MNLQIINGDCRTALAALPDQSVQCCVTSPPYWGLRDYGHADQIGQEDSPALFVQSLVQVFEQVWRVLRDDGTLWLNLGSSYASTGGELTYGSSDGKTGRGPSTKRNKFSASRGSDSSQVPSRQNAPACGSDGKALPDSQAIDSACCDLCDECRAALLNCNDYTSPQPEQSPLPRETKDRDNEHSDFEKAIAAASPPSAQASTISESSSQHPEGCLHCANCGACLSVLRSSSRDARLCARRGQHNDGTFPRGLDDHNQDKDVLVKAYPYLSTPSLNFKPKDMVPIPWMAAMALQEAGWYLRQDIIWSKPNPMPESVTDRCTKSHEYIFLLTKSPRYYYNAEAIAEPLAWGSVARLDQDVENQNGSDRVPGKTNGNMKAVARASWKGSSFDRGKTGEMQLTRGKGYSKPYTNGAAKDFEANGVQDASATKARIVDKILSGELVTRNKRSVWTVTTKPFSGAHFATFPSDLIQPCILAGSKPGDTILDPFGGSGTTGMVALELGRKAILVELNPEYISLIEKRTFVTPGLPL